MNKKTVIVDKVSGNPSLFQRPRRENDKCGRCNVELIRLGDGRFVCPKCGFSPWINSGTAIKF